MVNQAWNLNFWAFSSHFRQEIQIANILHCQFSKPNVIIFLIRDRKWSVHQISFILIPNMPILHSEIMKLEMPGPLWGSKKFSRLSHTTYFSIIRECSAIKEISAQGYFSKSIQLSILEVLLTNWLKEIWLITN